MKKALCIALAAALMVSAVGCGSSSGGKTLTPEDITEVDGKKMLGNMFVEGEQIVKEPVTIKLMSEYETRMTNFEEMKLFQELEEKTNVDIEWELIPSADWIQKKNLKLASGTLPDGFFAGVKEEDISKYGPQGMLIPLEDLIDQYAPNIKAAFEKYPEYAASCREVDGHIYSLYHIIVDSGAYNPDQMFINKTWLDKLNLPMPTTMDEFYDVLNHFKNDDPNGNGKQDEIPFSCRFDQYIQSYHSLFGAYGRGDIDGRDIYSHFVVEPGDKLVFTADKPEYKAAIEGMHKFFEAGLFDKEIFTQDVKQYFAKGKTEDETLGCFILWNRGNMVGPDRVDDYVAVPPFKGPDGKQIWVREMNGNSPTPAFAITNQCEHPEILVRWIDQFFDEKLCVRAGWGPIEEKENGPAVFAERDADQSFDDFRYQNAPIFGALALYGDYYDRVVEMPSMMTEKVEIMKDTYEPYLTNSSLPPLKFTQEEREWLDTHGVDFKNYIRDHQARWMLEGGIENEWDDYVKGLESLGLEEYVNIMNTAYQRYLGK